MREFKLDDIDVSGQKAGFAVAEIEAPQADVYKRQSESNAAVNSFMT